MTVEISISLYREVVDAIEPLQKRYKNNVKTLIHRARSRLDIRYTNLVLTALLETDELTYYNLATEFVDRILSSQVSPGEEIFADGKVYTAGEDLAGGFPTIISRRKEASSRYLDVDSTCHALNIILDHSRAASHWSEEHSEVLRTGLEFLFGRDINRDALLEQYRDEDWIPQLKREGSTLYTNSLYLATLEKAYHRLITGEEGYIIKVRDRLSNLLDRMDRAFYLGGRFIDYISSTGAKVLRNSIDNWIVTTCLAYRDGEKARKHLSEMVRRLDTEHGLTITQDLQQTEWGRREKAIYLIHPLHNALAAYALAVNKLYNEALSTMKKILPTTDKIKLVRGAGQSRYPNPFREETEIILIATYRIVSRELSR